MVITLCGYEWLFPSHVSGVLVKFTSLLQTNFVLTCNCQKTFLIANKEDVSQYLCLQITWRGCSGAITSYVKMNASQLQLSRYSESVWAGSIPDIETTEGCSFSEPDFLTAVTVKRAILRDVTPCSPTEIYCLVSLFTALHHMTLLSKFFFRFNFYLFVIIHKISLYVYIYKKVLLAWD